jgi:hypothetical protein
VEPPARMMPLRGGLLWVMGVWIKVLRPELSAQSG